MTNKEETHEINNKEDCFILLIDILGFSDFIRNTSKESEELLSNFYDDLSATSGPGEEKTKFQERRSETSIQHSLIFFSDTIIRIYPNQYRTFSSGPCTQTMYHEICDIQNIVLKSLKLLCRGCLHYGEISKFKFSSNNIPTIYGRGLVEAYEKEKNCPYPRIVVSDEANEKLREKSSEEMKLTRFPMKNIPIQNKGVNLVQNLTDELIEEDSDGKYFLPSFSEGIREILIEQYRPIENNIFFLKNGKKLTPKEKWNWYIDKFNACCEKKGRMDLKIILE